MTNEPIISAICKEPEGTTVRRIYQMQLTLDNLRTFWEKASQFKTIFSTEVNGDFKKFLETFLSQDASGVRLHGLFWQIDDMVGVYYMTHITEIEAQVHYTFFDRRHFGREELTKEMLRYAFRRYGFWRMNVEIPMYASKHTFGFINALGFKKEGRKRKAAEYKGERYDVGLFGILREDVLKGEDDIWAADRSTKKLVEDLQQDLPTTLLVGSRTDLTQDRLVEPQLLSEPTELIPLDQQQESPESLMTYSRVELGT